MEQEQRKKITIEVDTDIAHNLADILCYFAGIIDCKGEDWSNSWLQDSISRVRSLKIEIQEELRKTPPESKE